MERACRVVTVAATAAITGVGATGEGAIAAATGAACSYTKRELIHQVPILDRDQIFSFSSFSSNSTVNSQ